MAVINGTPHDLTGMSSDDVAELLRTREPISILQLSDGEEELFRALANSSDEHAPVFAHALQHASAHQSA